ncbi:retrotransposon protein, putative, ty1-copia subclass [Tanacetum coccineum]
MFMIELHNTTTSDSWVLYTGCGTHICTILQGLKESRRLKHGELNLVMGNRKITLVTRIGKYELMLKSGGCEVFIRQEAQDKLEARFEKCLFVGYLEDSFGYLFYKPKDNVVFVARRGVFLEREMISKEDSGKDKISDSTLSELDEPANYKEAMASPEAAKWKEAMKREIQSMLLVVGISASMRKSHILDFLEAKMSPVYVKVSGSVVVFLVLYMDDILLIENDIPTLQSVKDWLGKCFAMKDFGDTTYILGIKIYRDRSKRLIGLSQDTYLDKILKIFKMENSKKGNLPLHCHTPPMRKREV